MWGTNGPPPPRPRTASNEERSPRVPRNTPVNYGNGPAAADTKAHLLPNAPSLFPGGMGASLCVTASSMGPPAFNRRPECQPITAAPFTATDIDPLLKLVTQCPVDDLSTRVFQQHASMGTCWHDAFMMILFHIDPLKPAVQEHAKLLLEKLIEIGNSDLVYGGQRAIKATYRGEEYNDIEYINPAQKVMSISEVFREKYPGLPRSFWDMYVLALQRFLLVNYMFYKPEILGPARPKGLFMRRRSIAENEFSTLHSYFKETALKAPGAGLFCGSIGRLAPTIQEYVKQNTGNQYDVYRIGTPGVTDIQAYYIWMQYIHVFCLFKCGGLWFNFDNDIGVAPFSAEDSAKLSSVPIVDMDVADDHKDPMAFVYEYTLADGSKVSARANKATETPEKMGPSRYGKINGAASFIVARAAPAAAAAGGAGGGAATATGQGGGRRRRKTTRRRKGRKSTRRARRRAAAYARR